MAAGGMSGQKAAYAFSSQSLDERFYKTTSYIPTERGTVPGPPSGAVPLGPFPDREGEGSIGARIFTPPVLMIPRQGSDSHEFLQG